MKTKRKNDELHCFSLSEKQARSRQAAAARPSLSPLSPSLFPLALCCCALCLHLDVNSAQQQQQRKQQSVPCSRWRRPRRWHHCLC